MADDGRGSGGGRGDVGQCIWKMGSTGKGELGIGGSNLPKVEIILKMLHEKHCSRSQ